MDLTASYAKKFYDLFYQRKWIGDLSPHVSALSLAEAYQVQDQVAQMRVDQGEEIVGFKVGCTSPAIRSQFGLHEPISGRLFSPHIYEEDVRLNWRDYVQCAIEPEMVLRIGRDLNREGLADEELIEAIDYVSPGIEVHHFKFWFSPPSSQELICSGGIHAGLVIGDAKVSPDVLTFEREMFKVYKDGNSVTQAPASEIMGSPLNSLRWLVNSLVQRGMSLVKGCFVIPGSPTELIGITEDVNLKVEIDGVGCLTAEFNG